MQKLVPSNGKTRQVEFVTGDNIVFCPYCGSPNTTENEEEIKCNVCNMGKLKRGRR